MIINGNVFKYGDDINTDVIFPGKYTYTIKDKNEMAKHALEDLDPDFVNNVKENDVVVGGNNFGCGSSREQAAICLKYAGVGAVIANSFARIFFRNAINAGLLLIQCPEAVKDIESDSKIKIDTSNGEIIYNEKNYKFPPLPESVQEILNDGGLIAHLRKKFDKDDK